MARWRSLDKAVAGLNVNWCGSLLWDLPEPELLAFAKERLSQGYDIRVVDAAEARRIEPQLMDMPAIAVHAAGEGSVEPAHAVERVLAAAVDAGAELMRGTAVRWLVQNNGQVSGVMTEDGALDADTVVLSAGVSCKSLLAGAGLTLALDDPPGLLVHSKPAPEMLNGLAIAPELHVRQTAEGRLVAGTDFGGADPGLDPEATARLLFAKMQNFIRGGEVLELDHYAIGYRPMPRDGLPAAGFVHGFTGLYLCVSHSGVTLAPALGALGTNEIRGQGRHPFLAPFAPDRLISVT
jgi:glycine/D-amino acid oxidase-like deaminating enzyme